MKKLFISVLLLLSPHFAIAAPVGTGLITSMTTYTTYGGGDVVFKISNPVVGCDDGYWMRKSDDGFDTTWSFLLSAHHTKTEVAVWGYDDQLWAGDSSKKYCRLDWSRIEY